jgi:hypothetical protein
VNTVCPHKLVEIGHQNSRKILEQCVKNVCFSRFVVDERNLLHVCERYDLGAELAPRPIPFW